MMATERPGYVFTLTILHEWTGFLTIVINIFKKMEHLLFKQK